MLVILGGGPMSELLNVSNLTKVYRIGSLIGGIKLTAVENASFDVNKGEVFTLAGESGCGKTTVAKIILGFEEPTSGEIHYLGNRIDVLKDKERKKLFKHIQAVFQNPFTTFNPLRKVDSYFYELLRNFGIAQDLSEMKRIISETLEVVGISYNEFVDKYPNEFSGGQLQRISIARSLLTRPELLVADEPVSMVDASLRMSIVNLFGELVEKFGISILYITHDLMTAYYLGGKIAIMFRGNILEMGSTKQVLTEPKHPYTKLLIESIPQPNPRKAWNSRIKLSDLEEVEYKASGCKFAGRCPLVMDICKKEKPPYFEVEGTLVKCFLYK